MTVLAEFEAASPSLVLGPTLEALPSLTLELERQYALDPDHPIVFCWATYGDQDHLERTIADDETVDTFERVVHSPDRVLYRIRRSDSGVISAYRRWVSAGGELLHCLGTKGRWKAEMRFPDRDAFTEYHTFLEAENVEFELHRLSTGEAARRASDIKTLTKSQREALVLAHEHGFFDVPREANLATIADSLGISSQAVSERLRRGQSRLIDRYVRYSNY
ncbi:helix-turn-helix domain-containing protein [Natrarchaeobius chitinivorans]|uniref:Bacterio-opsin activator n=1 Tax=Natrarchaeobius chitinivorans TaxID=1679083 RepID=A0A3N6LZU4_NATCH|nr:helix-turn-helix domain-containing protein [Natrarchaeobius chitinivorans]RQG96463.1 bacterio-opsin activator [Natrarchaeobius chitinivorans]